MRANRIVSLLPGGTEIVCALGCAAQLKGRSHQCDFPPEIRALPVCASSRLPREASIAEMDREACSLRQFGLPHCVIDAERLRQIRPDLILTEGPGGLRGATQSDVEQALARVRSAGFHPKIISLSPVRMADLWQDIQTVADAIGVAERGRDLLLALKGRVVDVIQRTCLIKRRPAVVCLGWLDPLMAAGHWVPEMVDFAGGRNLFGQAGQPSTRLEWELLCQSDPDIIVLMPCGFDLARIRREAAELVERPEWRNLRAVKTGKVFLADANSYFSRPGPRLVDSLEILAEIVQPLLFRPSHNGNGWQKL